MISTEDVPVLFRVQYICSGIKVADRVALEHTQRGGDHRSRTDTLLGNISDGGVLCGTVYFCHRAQLVHIRSQASESYLYQELRFIATARP